MTNVSTEAALITGLSTLAGIVVLFWKIIHSHHQKALAELEACQAKHDKSDEKIVEITARVAYLEGKHEGVKTFAQQVLEVVSRTANQNLK